MEIKVGDTIRVKDWGGIYSLNTPWWERQVGIKKEWMINYAYGDESKCDTEKTTDDTEYEVLYINDQKAVITGKEALHSPFKIMGKVYLIDMLNIELYHQPPVEMTIKEIKEKLGIKNLKIIIGDED